MVRSWVVRVSLPSLAIRVGLQVRGSLVLGFLPLWFYVSLNNRGSLSFPVLMLFYPSGG
jgi:hypothetical protein